MKELASNEVVNVCGLENPLSKRALLKLKKSFEKENTPIPPATSTANAANLTSQQIKVKMANIAEQNLKNNESVVNEVKLIREAAVHEQKVNALQKLIEFNRARNDLEKVYELETKLMNLFESIATSL